MGDIGQRIGKIHFFIFQRLVLFPNAQQHFRYFAVENRQLALFQFVEIQTVGIVQHEIDLIGKPCDTPVSGFRKQEKGDAEDRS